MSKLSAIRYRPSYLDWKLGNGLVELVAHFKGQVVAEADVEIDFERVIPEPEVIHGFV